MERLHPVADMQASSHLVEPALSGAGVTGVQKAIRIRRGSAEARQTTLADWLTS
jgi:hypothetical protein